MSRRTPLIALIAACLLPGMASAQDGLALYRGFTLVDVEAERHVPDAWLTVRDGVIVETGAGAAPQAVYDQVHEMNGLYGMAGLIDAHAHITSGPQQVDVGPDGVLLQILSGDEYSGFNGAVALAFGVTTVRNPGGSTEANARYDAQVAAGAWAGPQALHAGSVIQPPPMGGASIAYPTTPEAWDAEAARQAAAGMRYFKLYTDLSEDELALGIAAAHRHGLKAIAHLNAVPWGRAVELGIDGLEHALPTSADLLEPEVRGQYDQAAPQYAYRWFELADLDGPLMTELVAALVAADVEVNLTLLVQDMVFHADDFDGWLRLLGVEEGHIHPATLNTSATNMAALSTVWSQEDFTRARATLPRIATFVRRLREAGVPLTLGTDGTGGGPFLARELSLHVQAGLTPWETLRLATAGNADRMGLGDRTGRIAPGMEADLVFLRADPVADVDHVRTVQTVVSDGQVWDADALLAEAQTYVTSSSSE